MLKITTPQVIHQLFNLIENVLLVFATLVLMFCGWLMIGAGLHLSLRFLNWLF